jgi:hypothetical protein
MTLSQVPQCTDNEEARRLLSAIADYGLFHNRDIVNRLDDSVVRVMLGRRARGYAPAPVRLATGFEHAGPLLAVGGELKSTFCLLKDGQAMLSQHIGDLEDAATLADYQKASLFIWRCTITCPRPIISPPNSAGSGRWRTDAGLRRSSTTTPISRAAWRKMRYHLARAPFSALRLTDSGSVRTVPCGVASSCSPTTSGLLPAGGDAGRRSGRAPTLAKRLCPCSSCDRLGALKAGACGARACAIPRFQAARRARLDDEQRDQQSPVEFVRTAARRRRRRGWNLPGGRVLRRRGRRRVGEYRRCTGSGASGPLQRS